MFSSALPETRAETWDLLDEFLGRWFPRSTSSTKIPPATLASTAARVGSRLPVALIEWFTRFGMRYDVWSVQDELLPLEKWEVKGDVLVFARECQNVMQWGIRHSDLELDDPPVLVSDSNDNRIWLPGTPSVSRFALHTAVLSAKFSPLPPFNANAGFQDDDAVLERLVAKYPRLPFPDLIWPVDPTYFLGTEEIVLEIEADTWLWVVALERAAMEELEHLVMPDMQLQRM